MAKEIYRDAKSPYWYFQAPVLDKMGKVINYIRRTTKRRVKGEAKIYAQKKCKEIMDSVQYSKKEDLPLFEMFEGFVALTESQDKADLKNQKIYLEFVKPFCLKSALRTSHFDVALLTKWRDEHIKLGYKPSYTNNLCTWLISTYNYGLTRGLDVEAGLKFSLKLKTSHKLRYLLDDQIDLETGEMYDEEARLLEQLDPKREINGMASYDKRSSLFAVEGERLKQRKLEDQYDLSVFLIDTGCRYSEAASSPRSVVDKDCKYINLYRSKVGNEGQLRVTNRLQPILEKRLRESNSPFLFPHPSDPSKSRGYSTKGLYKAFIRAGLNEDHLVERYGRFTAHSFRHTFASRLAQSGMDLLAISKLLGHTTTQMTQKYAHLIPSVGADRAADVLNERANR